MANACWAACRNMIAITWHVRCSPEIAMIERPNEFRIESARRSLPL